MACCVRQAAADAAENASIWPVVVALTVIVLMVAYHMQSTVAAVQQSTAESE